MTDGLASMRPAPAPAGLVYRAGRLIRWLYTSNPFYVLSADLPLLAQARPGDTVRFRLVGMDDAVRARRRISGWLDLDT